MRTIAKRIRHGRDLKAELQAIAEEESIRAGVVLSGVGGLGATRFRPAVLDGDNERRIAMDGVEIVSLHGTLSMEGMHVHITVSDSSGATFGGHLTEGCIVRLTCELVIADLADLEFSRELDEQTGYNEMVIKKLS